MPTRSAIIRVVVAATPRSVNSAAAASRIWARAGTSLADSGRCRGRPARDTVDTVPPTVAPPAVAVLVTALLHRRPTDVAPRTAGGWPSNTRATGPRST